MATMILEESVGTKARSPRHDYRPVKRKPEWTQRVRVRMIVLSPRTEKTQPPRTATVTRTHEGTLKGRGKTQTPPGHEQDGQTSVAPEEAVLMNLQGKGELVATVRVPTDVTAADLISRVTTQRSGGRITAEEASDLLFPFLFDGPGYERRQVFATLTKIATPEAILDTALRTHRLQGYEGYLSEAASLLSTFGAAAWPTIRKWAQLGGAETEGLVETAFSVKGVREADYLAGLKDLVARGDHNTRARALGALHILPERTQRDLLLVMAETGEPDDPSRDEARERLAQESA